MESCYLIRPDWQDADSVMQMVQEWRACGGRMNPRLLRSLQGDYADWMKILQNSDRKSDTGNTVPQTFYLLKSKENEILGAAALRHELNETNICSGGHVAYGIRPACRGNGYGNQILKLALDKLREMQIIKVLVTCDFDNYASQKIILHNGGILENQMMNDEGILENRYWIMNQAVRL